MNVGGNTAHHVVTSRYNRDGLLNGVDMRESAAQFADPGESGFENLLTEVIQLELHVIAVRAATPALENLKHH